MEASFVRLRGLPPATAAAFGASLAVVLAPGQESGAVRAVRRAGLAVLAVAEGLAKAGGEHPYHNRHHLAESMLAMGWLCAPALAQGVVTVEQAALGILAMAGHDLGHDGSRCLDGRLEAEASRATLRHARRAGLDDEACNLLDRLIRTTALCAVLPEVGGTEPDRAVRVLCLMAREADLFASFLPRLGWRLTFALRREWRTARDRAAHEVTTFAGRQAFLSTFRPRSQAACSVGLDAAASAQIRAFGLAADALGAGPGAAAGAAALDRLPRFRAARLYRSALRAAFDEGADPVQLPFRVACSLPLPFMPGRDGPAPGPAPGPG